MADTFVYVRPGESLYETLCRDVAPHAAGMDDGARRRLERLVKSVCDQNKDAYRKNENSFAVKVIFELLGVLA